MTFSETKNVWFVLVLKEYDSVISDTITHVEALPLKHWVLFKAFIFVFFFFFFFVCLFFFFLIMEKVQSFRGLENLPFSFYIFHLSIWLVKASLSMLMSFKVYLHAWQPAIYFIWHRAKSNCKSWYAKPFIRKSGSFASHQLYAWKQEERIKFQY